MKQIPKIAALLTMALAAGGGGYVLGQSESNEAGVWADQDAAYLNQAAKIGTQETLRIRAEHYLEAAGDPSATAYVLRMSGAMNKSAVPLEAMAIVQNHKLIEQNKRIIQLLESIEKKH